MHILVVEDYPEILEFLVEILQDKGHEVAGVSNAKEADALLANPSWDIMLSDFYVDGRKNGLELYFKAVRHGIFAIIMSGCEEARLLCEENNIPFLPKPFTTSKLSSIFNISSTYARAA